MTRMTRFQKWKTSTLRNDQISNMKRWTVKDYQILKIKNNEHHELSICFISDVHLFCICCTYLFSLLKSGHFWKLICSLCIFLFMVWACCGCLPRFFGTKLCDCILLRYVFHQGLWIWLDQLEDHEKLYHKSRIEIKQCNGIKHENKMKDNYFEPAPDPGWVGTCNFNDVSES